MQILECMYTHTHKTQLYRDRRKSLNGQQYYFSIKHSISTIFVVIMDFIFRVTLSSILLVMFGQFLCCSTSCDVRPRITFEAPDFNQTDVHQNTIVVKKIAGFTVMCSSSRNIEWDYSGQGAPSKVREESTVQVIPGEGKTSFCIISTLTFLPSPKDLDLSDHTGKYACREIHNTSNEESVHIFFPRKDGIVFLNSGNTLTVEATEIKSISLPCEVSDPNSNVLLYKRATDDTFHLVARSEDTVRFDPRYGYHLKTAFRSENDLGEYKCIVSKNAEVEKYSATKKLSTELIAELSTDFITLHVVKPKNFQAFPNRSEIYISGSLNLTCVAEEPVRLKEVLQSENDYDGMYSDEEIVETTEKTEEKAHVANFFDTSPAVGSFGEMQCISETDSRVLHTWKYRVITKSREKLSGIRYNKRDKSFTCKTMTGSPGKLSYINCRTPSECRINRKCLQQSESCQGYSSLTKMVCQPSNNQCAKVINRLASGIIRCVGDGVDEILEYTELANSTDLHFGFGKLKMEQTKLIKATNLENLSEGDEIKVSFKWGHYFFMKPFKWGLMYKNGSSVDTEPREETVTSNGFYSVKKASIMVPSADVSALVALIPLRDSPGYSVSKIPIHVHGYSRETVAEEQVSVTESEVESATLLRMDLDLEEGTTENTLSDQTEINTVTLSDDDVTTTWRRVTAEH